MSKEDKIKLDSIEVATDEEVTRDTLDEVFGAAVWRLITAKGEWCFCYPFYFLERSSEMAENKIVTLEQLRDLAEKGKLDTLSRINTLAESVIPLLESDAA